MVNRDARIEQMLAELASAERWQRMISIIRPQHPVQCTESIEDALGEAIIYFLDHQEKIINGTAEGLVLNRADFMLRHEWRRYKTHASLHETRNYEQCDESSPIDQQLDIERFLEYLSKDKRILFELLLSGATNSEIANLLGVKNNSALRMRILRILGDFRFFLKIKVKN